MPFPGRASCDHHENAMPWRDMEAIQRVANRRNEVITFRSTGPWAKRWIEAGFPTKGFHVKGKSSDWGPMAGLVPWEGRYSKVAPDAAKIEKGNKLNKEGVDHGYAQRISLVLSIEQLRVQATVACGVPPRAAVLTMTPVDGTSDYFLVAVRPNDGVQVPFYATNVGGDHFAIFGFPEGTIATQDGIRDVPGAIIEVMASTEADTTKPMTGDYDLFNICPSFSSYGSSLGQTVTFGGTAFGDHAATGITFAAGHGMDRVMDPRLHTGSASVHPGGSPNPLGDYTNRRNAYLQRYRSMIPASPEHTILKGQLQKLGILDDQGTEKPEAAWAEHGDMGNLTPRILQCILELNVEMGSGPMGLTRRVHHNAESHRNRLHGGLKEAELNDGEGLPITVFQPNMMGGQNPVTATGYDTIDTIETWEEFLTYATRLRAAGYYVPQAWHWG